jgi:hypothetical protein
VVAAEQTAEERHDQDLHGFTHGMLTTHADFINPDLLALLRAD